MATEMANQKPKRILYTPWRELQRYGLQRALFSRVTLFAASTSVLLSFLTPWGQLELLPFLAGFHAAMLGFGLSVFGFTILGGKDDFFEPVMKAKGEKGLDALREMVLLLWWPLLLHGIAFALCCVRLVYQPFWAEHSWAATGWRLLYLFVGAWAVCQNYFSMRYLFILAITRLKWRYNEHTQQSDVQLEDKQANDGDRNE